jgi:uncharacterized membrane protein YphA (DoxX/SURF4 family)
MLGGLLPAAGLLTRPAAFFILCTMATAAIFEHATEPFRPRQRRCRTARRRLPSRAGAAGGGTWMPGFSRR